jgi:hypothetical protein
LAIFVGDFIDWPEKQETVPPYGMVDAGAALAIMATTSSMHRRHTPVDASDPVSICAPIAAAKAPRIESSTKSS